MSRYPSYQASKTPWIEQVPTHWTQCALKHVVDDFVAGGTPSTSEPSFWADAGMGTPWVAIGDMSNRDVIWETEKSLTQAGLADRRLTPLPAGSVLYSMYASVGYAAILEISAVTNQAILGLDHSHEVDSRYLRAFLNAARPHVLREASSNTQDNLNAEKVKNLPFVLPPLNEQIAIADYLQTETKRIDGLIEEKLKLKELLIELRGATISDAVTKGLDSTVRMKKSGVAGLGSIPEHWETRSLRHVLDELAMNGLFKKSEDFGEGVPLINVTDLFSNSFCINSSSLDRVKCTTEEIKKYEVRRGDLFLVRSSLKMNGIAQFAVAKDVEESTVFECHVVRVRPDPKVCDSVYLVYYLNSSMVRHSLISRSKTTTMTTIDQNEALSTSVLVPPTSEQIAIANYLDSETKRIDGLVAHVDSEIELLKELRASTITDAVLGRIDIRQAAIH